jgi:hypothetical protein
MQGKHALTRTNDHGEVTFRISNGDRTIAEKTLWEDISTPEEIAEVERELRVAAAAPEMLDALRDAAKLLRGLADSEDRAGKHNAGVNVRAVEKKLYAAIAKATRTP